MWKLYRPHRAVLIRTPNISGQVAVCIEGSTSADGEVLEEGTGNLVKARVQMYFNQLRETLMVQEAAAINAVDTYVRERLCSIRQLQEELVGWLSQVRSVVSSLFERVGSPV